MRNSSPQPGHDPARNKSHCRAILEFFRGLPPDVPDRLCPSTQELIDTRQFGVRPPNRINDLVSGKFDGRRYDFERIACGRGLYRWRLHEPARAGYPKSSKQYALPISEAQSALCKEQPRKNVESDFMRRRREEQEQAAPLFVGMRS
jgi:hypothetical protein